MKPSTSPRTGPRARGFVAAAALLAGPLTAQTELQFWSPDPAHDAELGASVAFVDDFDGDGHRDVAAGAPLERRNGVQWVGAVHVYSSSTGDTLLTLHHPLTSSTFTEFGCAVVCPGDLDGDGTPDVVVGAPGDSLTWTQGGRVIAMSGAHGARLWDLGHAMFQYGRLGESLARIEDLDGDGVDDVLAGAPFRDGYGSVFVLSGATGQVIRRLNGTSPGEEFGHVVETIADLDGDGVEDIVVGAPGYDPPLHFPVEGRVLIHSGRTGNLIRRVYPARVHESRFGSAIAVLSDRDGDGLRDLAIGAPGNGTSSSFPTGAIRTHSTGTGAELASISGPDGRTMFGSEMAAAGDIDGDGWDDFAAGTERTGTTGSLTVHSGLDGAILFEFEGLENEYLGSAVAGGADVNGDGRPEVLVGGKIAFTPNFFNSHGVVRLFSHDPANGEAVCFGAVNSTGERGRLRAEGSLLLADNDLRLHAAGLPSGVPGLILTSRGFGLIPHPVTAGIASDGTLCVAGAPIGRSAVLFASPSGDALQNVDLNAIPDPTSPTYASAAVAGETWHWQLWYRDPSSSGGSNFTDAIAVTF